MNLFRFSFWQQSCLLIIGAGVGAAGDRVDGAVALQTAEGGSHGFVTAEIPLSSFYDAGRRVCDFRPGDLWNGSGSPWRELCFDVEKARLRREELVGCACYPATTEFTSIIVFIFRVAGNVVCSLLGYGFQHGYVMHSNGK